jgi:hypothetical protein
METTRPICPRLGHLVVPRPDFKGAGTGEGLIIDTRGIEVMVMQSDAEMIWVRRDQLEVISESR